MIFGISTVAYTLIHVLIALAGIGSGLIVVYGLLTGKTLNGWTAVFLFTTVATSVTGFGFPLDHLLPSHKLAIISLVVLAVAIAARYAFQMAGAWRAVYVITAALALYLNIFVGIVQAFEKIPALKALAPHQTELPFVIAQLGALAIFVILTVLAIKRFHPEAALATRSAASER